MYLEVDQFYNYGDFEHRVHFIWYTKYISEMFCITLIIFNWKTYQ